MLFRAIKTYLVGGLEQFLFSHIYGIIIPIDFHMFQRGGSSTNQQKSKPTMRLALQLRSLVNGIINQQTSLGGYKVVYNPIKSIYLP